MFTIAFGIVLGFIMLRLLFSLAFWEFIITWMFVAVPVGVLIGLIALFLNLP